MGARREHGGGRLVLLSRAARGDLVLLALQLGEIGKEGLGNDQSARFLHAGLPEAETADRRPPVVKRAGHTQAVQNAAFEPRPWTGFAIRKPQIGWP